MFDKKIYMILATDEAGGIGIGNQLPWRFKEDMAFFKRMTTSTEAEKKAVIMGRKTWDSIPEKFRPLKNRENIVVSRSRKLSIPHLASSLEEALDKAKALKSSCYLMGGASLYAEAIEKKLVDVIYLTQIKKRFDCDAFAPDLSMYHEKETLEEGESQSGLHYRIVRLEA